ncbi:unnamed protein product, partial [Ectocarpus sp. 4 AP-2014]
MGGCVWWSRRWQGLVRVRGLLEDGALRGERHRALLQIAQALWDARNMTELIRRSWGCTGASTSRYLNPVACLASSDTGGKKRQQHSSRRMCPTC